MNFNKIVNIERLTKEISSSSIVIALDSITSAGTSCNIVFKAELSDNDSNTLTNIVNTHIASPLVRTDIQPVSISSSVAPPPFASKLLPDGRKLFKRYRGIQSVVGAGVNTILYTILYPQVKFVGLDVMYAETLDTISLFILDSTTGTYSTIPNYVLNQFGFEVNISKDFFRQESNYDADLFQGMQIKIVYTSQSTKTIGINFNLSEVK